jgi:hypothetical protein
MDISESFIGGAVAATSDIAEGVRLHRGRVIYANPQR